MPLSVSGHGRNKWSSGATFNVTVSITNGDLVVVYYVTQDASPGTEISSVSDSAGAVTWQNSATYTSAKEYFNTTIMQIWYGVAKSTAASDTITIHLTQTPGAGAGTAACVISVSGADTTTPFDTNASLPAINADTSSNVTPTVTGISTDNANDMLIGFGSVLSGSAPTAGTAGGTAMSRIDFLSSISTGVDGGTESIADEYLVVSTKKSSISMTFTQSSNSGYIMLAHAIRAAATPTWVPSLFRNRALLSIGNVFQPTDFNIWTATFPTGNAWTVNATATINALSSVPQKTVTKDIFRNTLTIVSSVASLSSKVLNLASTLIMGNNLTKSFTKSIFSNLSFPPQLLQAFITAFGVVSLISSKFPILAPPSRKPAQTSYFIVPAISTGQTYTQTVTSTLGFASNPSKGFTKPIANYLTIISSFVRTWAATQVFNDNLIINSQLIKLMTKPIVSYLSIASSFSKAIGKQVSNFLSINGTMAKAYTRQFSSTLTIGGNVTKADTKPIANYLTISSSFARSWTITRTISNVLTIGSNLTKALTKPLIGALTVVSSITVSKTFNRSFSDAISVVSAIAKADTKPLVGYLSMASSMARTWSAHVSSTATLTIISAVAKSFNKGLTNNVTITSVYSRTASWLRQSNEILTISSNIVKGFTKATFLGTLLITSSITVSKTFFRSLSGALGISSAINKSLTKSLYGYLSIASTFVRTWTASQRLIGNLVVSSSITKNLNKGLMSILTIASVYSRVASFNRMLLGNLAIGSNLTKTLTKQTFLSNLTILASFSASRTYLRNLTDGLVFVSAITKSFTKSLNGDVVVNSNVMKTLAKQAFLSNLTIVGSFIISRTYLRNLADGLVFTSAITKSFARGLANNIGINSNIGKSLTKQAFNAFLTISGSLSASRTYLRSFSDGVGVVSALTKSTAKNLASYLNIASSLKTATVYTRGFTSTLVLASSQVKTIGKTVSTYLNVSSVFGGKSLTKAVNNNIGISSNISKSISKTFTDFLTFVGSFSANFRVIQILIPPLMASLTFVRYQLSSSTLQRMGFTKSFSKMSMTAPTLAVYKASKTVVKVVRTLFSWF